MEGYTVLYICDYAAKYTGSFVPSLLALKKAAGEHNEIHFLLPAAARQQPWICQLGENVSFCEFTPKSLSGQCAAMAKAWKGRNLIVHTHFVGDFNLFAVKRHFSLVFCHYHMMVPGDGTFMKKCKRAVRQFLYRGLVIIGVSPAVQADAARYFSGAKAECVANAVDFNRLDNCAGEPVRLGKAAGSGQFSVLIHASDFDCKGVDVGLKAIEELNEETDGRFRLYLTSNHPEQTRQRMEALVEKTDDFTIVSSVENIRSLYDAMDLYISPSREEAFGYAVVEASYCGCQVAASDIPGQNTMKVVPGILWIGKDDVPGLKKAILEAVGRQQTGEAAAVKEVQRSFVRNHFAMDQWAENVLSLYEKYAKTRR